MTLRSGTYEDTSTRVDLIPIRKRFGCMSTLPQEAVQTISTTRLCSLYASRLAQTHQPCSHAAKACPPKSKRHQLLPLSPISPNRAHRGHLSTNSVMHSNSVPLSR